MLKEQMSKALSVFKVKDEKNNKKKIENLAIFVIILVITIIVINMILKDDKNKENSQNILSSKTLAKQDTIEVDKDIEEDIFKKNLEEILSKIEGVGKTKVLVTYSQSSQFIPIYNEDNTISDTEESDSRRWK